MLGDTLCDRKTFHGESSDEEISDFVMTAMSSSSTLVDSSLKAPRSAAIAGIIFSLLTITYQGIIWNSIPINPLESPSQVIHHAKILSLATNLIPFAGIAFLWFMGVIRDRLGSLEDRLFATTFLGSGLLYVAMLFVSGALATGLLQALESRSDTMPYSDAYAVARTEIYQLTMTYATKMAGAFMITTSTISRRTRIVAPGLVVIGFILALLLLLSAGAIKWSPMIFPVWVLLISGWILVDSLRGAPQDEGGPSATVH
jgi:hypothetical protein